MTIIALDPGLADAGMVVLHEGRFVFRRTLQTRPLCADEFTDAYKRAGEMAWHVARTVEEIHEQLGPDCLLVAEGFYDMRNNWKRESRGRWKTPLMIGALHAHGLEPKWQHPQDVLGANKELIAMWKAKRFGVIPGDELLTNEHLRSAGAHALYAADMMRRMT